MEFKGGDWVVLADAVSRESSLAQILKTDSRRSIVKWLEDDTESNIRLDFLRHATPEEINAGHRLDHIVDINDMGDDAHIENHISPLCKTESQPVLIVERDNQIIERLKVENVVLQAKVDELQAENKILNQAAATHLRNQNQFMDLYNRLVEQLYPYALDLQDPPNFSLENCSHSYQLGVVDGYRIASENASFEILVMLESDVEYIRAQCGMLGGGGEV